MKRPFLTGLILSIAMQSYANDHIADTLLTNATIYGHERADTIAISQGRIVFVGDYDHAERFVSSSTDEIDLEQAFIMPGFIDNHNHVFEAASEAGGSCELDMDGLVEDQIPYLRACRASAPKNGWLTGYGFSIEAILAPENRRTPLEVIDEIYPDIPAVIMEQTSHSMWVNSKALQLAGISKNSPEPQGGKILKDEHTGELNGILLDNAGDIVMEMAWHSLKNQFKQSYDGLMVGLEEAAAHGITTIGDGRLYWKRGWLEVWQQAEQDQTLTARVSLRPWIYPTDGMKPQLDFLADIQSSNSDRLLIIDQVKMYSDGIFVNGTAKTLAPYLDTYIPDEPYGINYIEPKAMKSWLTELDKLGYSAHIHAIGDGAIRESLDAVEYVRASGSTRPYTLTHVELVDKQDIPRFAKLGVTADFQVGSDYVAQHDHQWAEAFLGARRTRALMNLNALHSTYANVTLSSDWNVHDINPLVGIANSIKMGKTGLPDVKNAIDAYTINAAQSLGLDQVTGSISVGKFADLAILDQDISHLSANKIADAQVLMTMLQGKIVFEREDE